MPIWMMVLRKARMLRFFFSFLIFAVTSVLTLEVLSDNPFLVDPETGMLEVDLEQLAVHVFEPLDQSGTARSNF